MSLIKKAAVVATGWVGDTLACTAVATSLVEERGLVVDFYMKWPQLEQVLNYETKFNTILYTDNALGKYRLWQKLHDYDLIVKEPSGWSHDEPFTTEIRRLAGCEPKPSFALPIGDYFRGMRLNKPNFARPLLMLSRDLYMRAFGRDIDAFVALLSEHAEISWVGLPPGKNSKKGKNTTLYLDAQKICMADYFIGPEGGLLWLAGALGQNTIYFTERIKHAKDMLKRGDSFKAVGNVNIFPEGRHTALPLDCTNFDAVRIISEIISKTPH